MIGNISGNYSSNTPARARGGAVSHSGARVLLQTATALSLIGPRRAGPGRTGKRRTAVPTQPREQRSVSGVRQRSGGERKAGVRIRESDGGQQAASSGKRKGRGAGRQQPARPAGGRTGSTAPASSRRDERLGEASEDLAPRSRRATDTCIGSCIEKRAMVLDAHNFHRIHEDLGGYYRLDDDVTLEGEQAQRLPIGNSTHPFTGVLYNRRSVLRVMLTRSQGDALLFGAIDNSLIHLTVAHSRLETGNGSRAALIGEMGSGNLVTFSLLDNMFNATGAGPVTVGLVARTTGSGNRLTLERARGNHLYARSLPGTEDSIAMASLGLGVISSTGEQTINQQGLMFNHLQAVAASDAGAGALAALLGFPDGKSSARQSLKSDQYGLQDNRVSALVEGADTSGARSCASLGYAGFDCGRSNTTGQWTGHLWVSQAGFDNNLASARVGNRPGNHSLEAGIGLQDGLARASLVSTEPVDRLDLLHRGITPGQLQAEAAIAQRALLPPTRHAAVRLLSGGDDSVPLFGSWGAPHNCSIANGPGRRWRDTQASVLDTASYRLASFNCDQNRADKKFRADSLQPADWRWAFDVFAAFGQRFAGEPLLDGVDSRLHYPNEVVQSLVTGESTWGQWMLVTRQTWPGLADHNARGLLRVTRYDPPGGGYALPQSETPAIAGFQLYQSWPANAPLQDGVPVQALAHKGYLFHVYQAQGQSAQLVATPGLITDDYYRLAQYDALPGRARLLSAEDGELHLWMQQEGNSSDSLQVYGLGKDAPATNTSTRLRWSFDLSDQPGGRALLARSGDWLYSVRQNGDLESSLRRWQLASGKIDSHWQPVWPGAVDERSQSLVVDNGRLMALASATLPDPNRAVGIGRRAQLPETGGLVQWWTFEGMPWLDLPTPAPATPASGAESPTAQSATSSARWQPGTRQEPSAPTFAQQFFGSAGIAAGAVFVPGAAVMGGVLACICCAEKKRGKAQKEAEPRVSDEQPVTAVAAEESAAV